MKFLIFLGTVRDSTPPRPARFGERVAKAVMACLQLRYNEHDVELIDPLDYPLDAIFKPHFAYAKGKAPAELNTLAEKLPIVMAMSWLAPSTITL